MKNLCFCRNPYLSSFTAHYPSHSRLSLPAPSRSLTDSVMVQTLEVADSLVVKWDSDTSAYTKVTSLFYENRKEALEFVKIVNNLHKAMQSLVGQNSKSEFLIRAQHLMQIAMKRLQKEFYQMLTLNRAELDPESVSTRSSRTSARSSLSDFVDESDDELQAATELITEVEDAAEGVMTDLKSIADCMISSGYGSECVKIYKVIRKSIVDEGIYKLGVEKIKSARVHNMDNEVLDLKIRNWLEAMKIAVKTLFNGERVLCDQVFSSSDSIRESCYMEITKEGASILLSFPENVTKNSKKSRERIFRTLDMYTAIADLLPEIASIFSFPSTDSVVKQARNSLTKLGESVQSDFTEFATLLNKESLKNLVADAGVHKFTTNTMSYLSLLVDYNVLAEIIFNCQPPENFLMPESFFQQSWLENSYSPVVSLWLAWIIFITVCKLDGKAEHYKDVSHAYLFLANNLQHIISTVRSSNLRYHLGDGWITKRESEVEKFAVNYERVAWNLVIDVVPKNARDLAVDEARNCFNRINTVFEDTCRKQLAVVIPNSKLRDDIKMSVAGKLLPAYREFYNAHKVEIENDEEYAGVLKYSPEEMGKALSYMFFQTGRDSSSTSWLLSESRTSLSL